MQGDELKTLRRRAKMTQAEFAGAMGLTGTFMGLMERGEKPIEKRTELAARWIVSQIEQSEQVPERST